MAPSRLLPLATGLLALVCTATSAKAESAPAPRPLCSGSIVPKGDSRVPSNAPALVVVAYGEGLTPKVDTFSPPTGPFTLQPDTRSSATLLVPSVPLPVTSAASVQVSGACSNKEPFTAASRFSVVAAAPLPTIAGSVEALKSTRERQVLLGFRPSPELTPFLAVTMLEVRRNGKPLDNATTLYGELLVKADGRAEVGFGYSRPWSDLCGPLDHESKSVRLEVQVHVAGATSDPPAVPVDVVLDCSAEPSPPPAPTSPPAPTDAGVDDPGATNPSNLADSGGCSAGATSPTPLGLLSLVALGVLAAARRGRRR